MGSLFVQGQHVCRVPLHGLFVCSRPSWAGEAGCVPVLRFGSFWFGSVVVVVVVGLVGGGSRACRVPVTQVALCERRAGALSERKKVTACRAFLCRWRGYR